jgi:chorismate synthase
MSGVWGKNIKLSIFGESHGNAIGIIIDGLPSGVELDIDFIKSEMKRRAPGNSALSTPRKEGDVFEILSGYYDGKTTGTPLCSIIRNSDQHSKDYENLKVMIRPSHADYTGNIKYKGFNDHRGGGHFSGRITAPLVFAGAIAKQLLKEKGIIIGSHIKSIHNIKDEVFDKVNLKEELLNNLLKEDFPVINKVALNDMVNKILTVKKELNSVGGVIETAVLNLPAGIGSPFFDSLESHLSHLLFSIPAVKGVQFGEGFAITEMTGAEANDEYYMEDNKVKTRTNNNGGILGGITSGMPVVFSTAFKPTASIARSQNTIDIEKLQDIKLEIKGRHDPCIVPRAVPVVEAAAALAILDLLYDNK